MNTSHQAISDYLAQLNNAKSSRAVWKCFTDFASDNGCIAVTYGFRKLPHTQSRKGVLDQIDTQNLTFVTNLPKECVDYWLQRRLEKIDPMIDHIQHSITPLLIGKPFLKTTAPNYKELNDLYTLGEEFNIKCSYGIPLKQNDTNTVGEVVYYTNLDEDEFLEMLSTSSAVLHMAAHYMHTMFQPLERRARADIIGLKGRPVEVMHLMNEGYTNTQIAQALNLSPATVSFHVKELKEKLGATSTRDILPTAMRLNILHS